MSAKETIRAQISVLAVDDDEGIRTVLGAILHAAGYRVTLARSGEEAIRVARNEHPDVILLDVEMPGLNGYQTAAALSGSEETRSIPIMVLTALSAVEDRLRALKAGAVDFLSKPVDPDLLTHKVESLARLKAYHDDMKRQRTELLAEVAGKSGQLQEALDSFARFVPREFLRCLSKKSILDIALGDQVLTDMAILFSDIRSFTSLSEKMTPRQIFKFLNSYLERMNPFIWENDGFIDKYIGDGIMALFPSGAEAALKAAIAMLSHIPLYNAQRASFGYDPIRVGIGVHAGPVMLGVIGHERFMQGTVMSDSVNLASRLEGLTKVYGVSLVVSSHVLFGLDDPNRYGYRFLDQVRVKGKEELVSVYEVFDGDPPDTIERKRKTRETFEKGVYEYHTGNFAAAFGLLESIRDEETPDRPLEIYRQRCRYSMKPDSVGGVPSASIP